MMGIQVPPLSLTEKLPPAQARTTLPRYVGSLSTYLVHCLTPIPLCPARMLVRWSVAWEPKMGSVEPLSSLLHLPNGQGGELRGGEGPWTQSFPLAPPTFRVPRPIIPWPSTNKTTDSPAHPSDCTHSCRQGERSDGAVGN